MHPKTCDFLAIKSCGERRLAEQIFLWNFVFEPPDFFRGFCRRIFSPGFCGKKVPRKILLQENPRQNPPKIILQNPRHIAAEGPDQKLLENGGCSAIEMGKTDSPAGIPAIPESQIAVSHRSRMVMHGFGTPRYASAFLGREIREKHEWREVAFLVEAAFFPAPTKDQLATDKPHRPNSFRRVTCTPDPDTLEKYRDAPPISIAILCKGMPSSLKGGGFGRGGGVFPIRTRLSRFGLVRPDLPFLSFVSEVSKRGWREGVGDERGPKHSENCSSELCSPSPEAGIGKGHRKEI